MEYDAEYEAGKLQFAKKFKPQLPDMYRTYGAWSTTVMLWLSLCIEGNAQGMTADEASDCMNFIQEMADATGTADVPEHLNVAYPEMREMEGLRDEIVDRLKAKQRVEPEMVKRCMYLMARQINFIEATMKETGMM